MKMHTKSKGYSIIEIIVVLAIVAILVSIAIPTYNNYVARAKVLAVVQFLSKYEDTMSLYYNKHSAFPATLDDIPLNTPTLNSGYPATIEWVWWNNQEPSPNNYPKAWLGAKVIDELGGGIVSIAAVVDNPEGVIKFSCGFWNSDGAYTGTTQPYLPTGCSELNQEGL